MKKVLVSGGCGYIGSHTIIDLIDNGFEVVSVDNLVNSSDEVLDGIERITGVKVSNYAVDLCDLEKTQQIFKDHPDIVGVIHFAALKSVGESVEQPMRYFRNNLNSLLNIVDAAQRHGVNHFIFSSSCSVYGNAKDLPVTEDTPMEPAESPYARTKQLGEQILQDFVLAHPEFKTIILRYFNPAGAHESTLVGEAPLNPALSLVPVITETASGKRSKMMVYGNDYDTRDGSCIRDYIHIMDLANAHTKAMQYALKVATTPLCEVFNLGMGEGVTVLEAIKAFEKVSGQALNYELGPRRAGDVIAIYANKDKAVRLLGWEAKRNIEDIMRTAWAWEQRGAVVQVDR
ncbi:MAG: UDP-glucose 4-epimerase GalE [Bacteroidota bacterium]